MATFSPFSPRGLETYLPWHILCSSVLFVRAGEIPHGLITPECAELVRTSSASAAPDLQWSWEDLEAEIRRRELGEALLCAQSLTGVGREHASAVARVFEHVANHPQCISELDTKTEFEDRCAQKWYKISLTTLWANGEKEAAASTWQRAVAARPPSGNPQAMIKWPSELQTPTLWVPGLRSAPFWDCRAWPFVQTLEAHSLDILREVLSIRESFGSAYPYLKQQGSWQTLFLLRGRQWDHELCGAMPIVCRLLLPELPTKPDVPFCTRYNEEVVIFRSLPGTTVSSHSGASNSVVNLHLTLKGASGAVLKVGEEAAQLKDGQALCFQDSYLHSLEHSEGEERISLVLRVMHPDAHAGMYGEATRTDAMSLSEWDSNANLKAEVERLRLEYRKLASASRDASNVAPLTVCNLTEGT